MIDFKDFEDEKGRIDWVAYGEAKVANGDICYRCGQGILFGRDGHKVLCSDCQSADTDKGEVTHGSLIRCPKCQSMSECMDGDNWDLLTEGEHELTCYDCEHEFVISTSVSYSFTSPALEEK